MSTVPALFRGLVDDAALFPPGNAPMSRAVAEHRHHRAAPYADLVGRFLCRSSQLLDPLAYLKAGETFAIGVIADLGGTEASIAIAEQREYQGDELASTLLIEAVEIPLDAGAPLPPQVAEIAHRVPDAASYLEIPRVPGWRDAVEACAAERAGAKLRTGGLAAGAFPTEREVAEFITACVEADVPFKCTAGLHQAVRHTDPVTGFEHHGFLNLVVATHTALTGGNVVDAVAERDGASLAAACRSIDAAAVRARFVSYGSCSVAEPLADLAALALLDAGLLDYLPRAPGDPTATEESA
jgi:hypothetical protein